MRTLISRGLRTLGVVAVAMLVLQILQPSRALAQTPPPVLTLQKWVSANNSAFTASQTVAPGSTLMYQLAYVNLGGSTATGVTITDTLQPGQTIQAVSPGCTASVQAGLTVVSCPVGSVPSYPQANSVGAVYIQTTTNANFAGTIQNTGHISGTNAAGGNSGTTTVTVTGTPSTPYALTKLVAVNGTVFGSSGSAHIGDTLTYWLSFTNSTGSTLPSVTITDTLQPFQGFLAPPFSSSVCNSFNVGTRTVTCTLTNVPANSTTNFFIEAGVQNGASTITNQASAAIGAVSVVSNSTTVSVGAPPVFLSGNFILCGTVASYVPATSTTSGHITIAGLTVTIAAGATLSGQPFVIGMNACVTFVMNNTGQAVALSFSPNLTALNVVCGVFGGGTAASVVLSGMTVPTAVNFTGALVPGNLYCFVLNSTGQAYILLSTIPTGITAPNANHPASGSGQRSQHELRL